MSTYRWCVLFYIVYCMYSTMNIANDYIANTKNQIHCDSRGTQHFHRVGQHVFQLVVALSSYTNSSNSNSRTAVYHTISLYLFLSLSFFSHVYIHIFDIERGMNVHLKASSLCCANVCIRCGVLSFICCRLFKVKLVSRFRSNTWKTAEIK